MNFLLYKLYKLIVPSWYLHFWVVVLRYNNSLTQNSVMKKLIALMLVASFTGAVIAQQAAPQTKPAAPAKTAPAVDKDKKEKKHHKHHHRHHKPAEKKA